MPLLDNFLETQFSVEQRVEFGNLIEELGLRSFFNNTIRVLDDPTIEKDEITIAAISAGLLRTINHRLAKFPTVEDKISRQRTFGILLERLLVLLISKNMNDTERIFNALDRSLYVTCLQQGYDHKLMKKLFDFDSLKHVIYSLKVQNIAFAPAPINQKPQRYLWLQKGNLHILVDLLLKFNYIKSKKEFFDVFFREDEEPIVRWNKDKKYNLALLLSRLFNEGFAKIEGNKGYFAYAEKHFVTFENSSFIPNSLKKLSSVVLKNPESYKSTVSEVEQIIQSISR